MCVYVRVCVGRYNLIYLSIIFVNFALFVYIFFCFLSCFIFVKISLSLSLSPSLYFPFPVFFSLSPLYFPFTLFFFSISTPISRFSSSLLLSILSSLFSSFFFLLNDLIKVFHCKTYRVQKVRN